jgi:hypothetical protein
MLIWTLRFSKLEHLIFQGLERGEVSVAILFLSSHLSFYAMLSIETLLAMHVVSLLIEWHSYTQDKNIKYFSSTWACTRLFLSLHSFLSLCGMPYLILLQHWLLEVVTSITSHVWSILTFDLQFWLLISKSLHILIQKKLTLGDMWFFMDSLTSGIKSGTSMPSLPLALLWCILHHG